MDGLIQIAKWVAVVGLLAILLAARASAQSPQREGAILQDLHVHGTVGMNYDRDWTDFTGASSFGQEISTDLNGALFNPNFLSFANSFTYAHYSNNLNSNSMGSGSTIAGSANVMLLPASPYPFTITWQRVRVGVGQYGIDSTTNQDRLGFDWRLQLSKIPKLAMHYETDSTSSDVPVGMYSLSESKSSGFSFSATDIFKGFDWSAGWQYSKSLSQEMLLSDVLPLDQHYSILWGNVTRRYLGDKGTMNYNFSRDVTSTDLGTISAIDGVLTVHNATSSIRWTPKFTTSAYFSYYSFDNHGQTLDVTDPNGSIIFVNYPSSGYTGTGMAQYQLTKHLWLSDTTSYSTANNDYVTTNRNGIPLAEQAQTFFTTYPAINANFSLKTVSLTASYGVGYLDAITTLGRSFSSLGQMGSLSGTWTRPWLTLTGNVSVGNSPMAVIPGAYTDNTSYGLTAESRKFRRVGLLRFRYQVFNQDMLSSTGWVQSHNNQWAATLMRRRWQVDVGQSGASGAHQMYELPVGSFQPLPPLVGVPLLNDTYHSWFITASGQLRRDLHVSGTLRKTTNDVVLTRGSADYSLYEINADYRIGKILMQAMFGHYLNVSNLPGSSWGAGANRFRFRIVRAFNLF